MFVHDLVKTIGFNKPCIYSAPRGEVVMYCVESRTNKTKEQYKLLGIVNDTIGNAIVAWYDGDDVLNNFKLIDYIE